MRCVAPTFEAIDETDEHVLEIIYAVRGNASRLAGNARSPAKELFQAAETKESSSPRLNEAAVERVSL